MAAEISDPSGPQSTAEKDMKMNNVKTQHELIKKYKAHQHMMTIYWAGIRPDGPLCRRHLEIISEYVRRRRKWHEMLVVLDPTFSISQDMLSMYLLDFANISAQEKMSVLAWAGESMNFETTAEHLERICSYSHLRDIVDCPSGPQLRGEWSFKLIGPQLRGDWNW